MKKYKLVNNLDFLQVFIQTIFWILASLITLGLAIPFFAYYFIKIIINNTDLIEVENDDKNEKLCPYCSESIKKTAIKCKHCQSSINYQDSPRKCPYCRTENASDAAVCGSCRKILPQT